MPIYVDAFDVGAWKLVGVLKLPTARSIICFRETADGGLRGDHCFHIGLWEREWDDRVQGGVCLGLMVKWEPVRRRHVGNVLEWPSAPLSTSPSHQGFSDYSRWPLAEHRFTLDPPGPPLSRYTRRPVKGKRVGKH